MEDFRRSCRAELTAVRRAKMITALKDMDIADAVGFSTSFGNGRWPIDFGMFAEFSASGLLTQCLSIDFDSHCTPQDSIL